MARSIHDPTEKRNKLKDMGFVFAVDHCFTITGQGTILTGTVLSGTTSVGQVTCTCLIFYLITNISS